MRVFGCSLLQDILGSIFPIEDHILFVLKMDRQVIDGGIFQMHGKFKEMPCCLHGRNVATVQVGLDLVVTLGLQSGTVWSLVNVLVHIFHRLDGGADLNIDVALELHQELSAMRNHIPVGVGGDIPCTSSPTLFEDGMTVVRAGILGITVVVHDGLFTEGLWIVLLTPAILQTTVWAAWTMQHELGDHFIELRMEVLIRDLSRYGGIDLLSGANLVSLLQEDQEMHVGKASLLILDGIHQSSHSTIETVPHFLQQVLLFQEKDACHQVRMIDGSLTYNKM
jgi:hypothetical protein